ncbi:MAG: alpha/beta hydrolase-fold protein [Verrucomicrobiota bacterium]
MINNTCTVCLLSLLLSVGAWTVTPAHSAEESAPAAALPWNALKGPTVPGVVHHSFASKVVGKEVGYNVWLPPGYAGGKARYPVLYFLPGNGGNEYACVSPVVRHVSAAVETKILPPVIVIFCNPGNGTFRDNRTPGVLGETMFVTEFVPEIDRQFRTLAARDSRAVMGFSMGGSGTLRFVLGHPEMFCAGISWGSPRLREEEPAMSRLDQVKQAGSAVMIVVGDKEAPQAQAAAPEFVKVLLAHGISVQLKTPPNVPHNIDLYLKATWDDAAKLLNQQLKFTSTQ